MAAINLLPGIGGQYVSEIFTATSTNSIGTDTIDCSKCAQLAVSGTSFGTGTYQLEQTFNAGTGAMWFKFGTSISVASANTLFDVTDGPFGILRIAIPALTAGTTRLTITGFPMQRMF